MKNRSKDKCYIIRKFDWNAFKFQKVRPKNPMYPGRTSRKKMDQNTKNYINWLMDTLRKRSIPEPPEGKNYNAMAVTMNAKNVNRLHDLMHPFDWLNYAPVGDNALADDEFGIYLNRIIVDDPKSGR